MLASCLTHESADNESGQSYLQEALLVEQQADGSAGVTLDAEGSPEDEQSVEDEGSNQDNESFEVDLCKMDSLIRLEDWADQLPECVSALEAYGAWASTAGRPPPGFGYRSWDGEFDPMGDGGEDRDTLEGPPVWRVLLPRPAT